MVKKSAMSLDRNNSLIIMLLIGFVLWLVPALLTNGGELRSAWGVPSSIIIVGVNLAYVIRMKSRSTLAALLFTLGISSASLVGITTYYPISIESDFVEILIVIVGAAQIFLLSFIPAVVGQLIGSYIVNNRK